MQSRDQSTWLTLFVHEQTRSARVIQPVVRNSVIVLGAVDVVAAASRSAVLGVSNLEQFLFSATSIRLSSINSATRF